MSSPVPLTGTYIIFSLISYCYFMTDSIRMLISQLYSYVISTHMQLCTGTNNLFSHVLFTAYEFFRAPVFFIHRYPLSLNCYPTFFCRTGPFFFTPHRIHHFVGFPLVFLATIFFCWVRVWFWIVQALCRMMVLCCPETENTHILADPCNISG